MTRLPSTIHALPVDARGDHRPSASCSCRPILATDMLEGPQGRVIYVHRDAPDVAGPELGPKGRTS
ncbi:MAG: hypothetical protein M0T75_08525 [Chloroflexi bacterium]|nr:hypothetical protein [Chloroflexota bacterium]